MAGLIKRGNTYHAIYYLGGEERRRSLETSSYQVAKERLRQLEASLAVGDPDSQLPTNTPVASLVAAYVEYINTTKTRSSIRVDRWYLRSIFGPICPALEGIDERKNKKKGGRKKTRANSPHIKTPYLEQITTAMIAQLIDAKVQCDGIAPKTANRYREILMRLFSWAMDQRGVRMPGGINPVAKVERRRTPAVQIRFLSLEQVEEQLEALADAQQLQTMVAAYIYAGLRREELLWLTVEDVDLKAGKYGVIRIRAKTVNGASWEPKTKVNRAVPISAALRDHLRYYVPPVVPGRWYFSTPKGKHWDPDNFSRALREANKKAGLTWSCLDYRHTFGSQLAMKGESLYKISALMGNSPDICRRHYAALLPEALVDSVEFTDVAPSTKPTGPSEPRLRVISTNGKLLESK